MAFYNQVAVSDNSFTNNTKVKLVAGAVADELDYIKASVSKMDQSEFKNKKYGRTYQLYLPDVGSVKEGIEASPDDITEVPVDIKLNNFNTSCTIDAWNELGDIESFTDQIAKPRAQHLARQMGKSVIKDNVFKDMQFVKTETAPTFGILSDASAALNELAVGGEIVSFMHPTVMGKIAAGGLANFIPGQEAKEIYGKNYLGQYAGAEQLNCSLLPTITTPATASAPTATISLTPVTDGVNTIGYEEVKQISGTNLFAGAVFTVAGLKIVDQSGIETDQDAVIIVHSTNAGGTVGYISPLRITVTGKNCGNPNAWVAAAGSLTLVYALEDETTYFVGQVRTKDAFAFDSYKFGNLPGSENEDVSTVGNITVKMSTYGDGTNLSKLIRLDVPHAGGIWDARSAVLVLVKKA